MNSADRITDFVLRHVSSESRGEQALLFQALADLTADEQFSSRFATLASMLQEVDKRQAELALNLAACDQSQQQLLLDFRRKHGGAA
ncbi:MAG: hypothetical protein HZC55_04175 [Verrucomicrobia bacterium]|nr:hypothetical protein [Verrucomicrobiota bacterium]